MTALDAKTITAFIHAQAAAWNRRDKDAFLAEYRKVAPGKFTAEYVGRAPPADGWAVLDQMWERTNAAVDVEEVLLVATGTEAACHNINHMPAQNMKIKTIELYKFDGGDLTVRYFIKQ